MWVSQLFFTTTTTNAGVQNANVLMFPQIFAVYRESPFLDCYNPQYIKGSIIPQFTINQQGFWTAKDQLWSLQYLSHFLGVEARFPQKRRSIINKRDASVSWREHLGVSKCVKWDPRLGASAQLATELYMLYLYHPVPQLLSGDSTIAIESGKKGW